MYRIELLIDDDIPENFQASTYLEPEMIIDVGDSEGNGIVGRVISITIKEN